MVMVHMGIRKPEAIGWARDLDRAQQKGLGVRIVFWRSTTWRDRLKQRTTGALSGALAKFHSDLM